MSVVITFNLLICICEIYTYFISLSLLYFFLPISFLYLFFILICGILSLIENTLKCLISYNNHRHKPQRNLVERKSELLANDKNNDDNEDTIDSNLVDSSNNQLIEWENCDEDSSNECDEKIYEDLCYVTISSTFPSEVLIKLILSLSYICALCIIVFLSLVIVSST